MNRYELSRSVKRPFLRLLRFFETVWVSEMKCPPRHSLQKRLPWTAVNDILLTIQRTNIARHCENAGIWHGLPHTYPIRTKKIYCSHVTKQSLEIVCVIEWPNVIQHTAVWKPGSHIQSEQNACPTLYHERKWNWRATLQRAVRWLSSLILGQQRLWD